MINRISFLFKYLFVGFNFYWAVEAVVNKEYTRGIFLAILVFILFFVLETQRRLIREEGEN